MNRIREVTRVSQLRKGHILLKHRIESSKAPCFPTPSAYYIADVSGIHGFCVWPAIASHFFFTLPPSWRVI